MSILVVVVMGVSGSGKSTIGKLLADKLACEFLEGDSLHPACNILKMAGGMPLTDDDRMPWLLALHANMKECLTSGRRLVVSCSALKPAYRRVLMYGNVHWQPTLRYSAPHQTPPVPSKSESPSPGCSNLRLHNSLKEDDNNATHPATVSRHCDEVTPPASRVAFVLLDPPKAELYRRLQERERSGVHFMPARLLDSQLDALSYSEEELFAHFRGPDADADADKQAASALRVIADSCGTGGGSACADCQGGSSSCYSGDFGGAHNSGHGSFLDPQSIVDQLLQRL